MAYTESEHLLELLYEAEQNQGKLRTAIHESIRGLNCLIACLEIENTLTARNLAHQIQQKLQKISY